MEWRGPNGAQFARPTASGRRLVDQWAAEGSSPAFQGKRILRHLYALQQDFPLVKRRAGLAGRIDVDELCDEFGIELPTCTRAVHWAIRQEYADLLDFDQATVEGGDVYITDEGMNAVDDDFKPREVVSGATIINQNIQDSQVYGNVLAAGQMPW